jgi:hypothetical protein
MEKCDALDTDDLVRSACLLGMNSLFLTRLRQLWIYTKFRTLFAASLRLFSCTVALYIRVSPLDLGHMSSSSFVLYWSQILPPPLPEKALWCIPLTLYLSLPIIRTSFRESVKWFVTVWRPKNWGSISSSLQKIRSSPKSPDRLWDVFSLLFNSKRWQIRRSVKLTTHIYPLRRIKMCAAILDSPLFLHVAVKSDLHTRNLSTQNCSTM